jgi:hypothetical protein
VSFIAYSDYDELLLTPNVQGRPFRCRHRPWMSFVTIACVLSGVEKL